MEHWVSIFTRYVLCWAIVFTCKDTSSLLNTPQSHVFNKKKTSHTWWKQKRFFSRKTQDNVEGIGENFRIRANHNSRDKLVKGNFLEFVIHLHTHTNVAQKHVCKATENLWPIGYKMALVWIKVRNTNLTKTYCTFSFKWTLNILGCFITKKKSLFRMLELCLIGPTRMIAK